MEPARSANRRSSCHLARRSRGRIGKLAALLRYLDASKCSPTRQIRAFRVTMGSMSASDAAPLPRLGEVFFDVRGSARSMRLSWYADTDVAVFSIWQAGTCACTFRLPMGELERMIETLRRGPGGRPPADPAFSDPLALGAWDDEAALDHEEAGDQEPSGDQEAAGPIMRAAMTPAVIRPVSARIRPVSARWTTLAHVLRRITCPRRPTPATAANPLARRASQGPITAKPFPAVAVAASRPSLSATLRRPVPERIWPSWPAPIPVAPGFGGDGLLM